MYATFNVLVSSGASVFHRSFSMKESWEFSKEKLVSAEEGLKSVEPVTRGSICSCRPLIQCAKLVLYIELILFLGWSSYTLWQAYEQQRNIKFLNAICPDDVPTPDIEASKVFNEVLTESPLKVVEDSTDEIKIKENGPSQENAFPTEVLPTDDQLNALSAQDLMTSEGYLTADSTESSASNEDEEIESLENRPVFDWVFPLLWNIHQDNSHFTDDSSMESRRELGDRFDEALKRFYGSDEKEEINPVLESRQTLSEEETQEQNKKEESNFNSDSILSSAEIINRLIKRYEKNIKAILQDSYLKNVDDTSLEKEENSKMDSAFSSSDSSLGFTTWRTLMQESIERLPLSKESKESIIAYPGAFIWREVPIFFRSGNLGFGYSNPVTLSEHDDSEKSDTSEVDKTTTHLTSDIWDQQSSLQPFVKWRTWGKSFEVTPSDETTEENTHEETSTISAYAKDDLVSERPSKIYVPLPQKQDDDFEQETLHDRVLPFNCLKRVVNGTKIIECSSSLVDIDRSSEFSDPTDSKSDGSTEEYRGFTEKNHWPVAEIAEEKNISNNTDLSNEKSDSYGNVTHFQEKSIETSTSWEDSSVFSEIAESELRDFAGGWKHEVSTESSQDDWFPDYYGEYDR